MVYPYRRPSRSRNRAKLLLYDYPANRARLTEIESHYMARTGEPGRPSRNRVSDPTARAATGLADDEEARRLRREVGAVDKAIANVQRICKPEKARQILEMARRVYFQRRCSLVGYAAWAGISERTVRRWNKLLVKSVERHINWAIEKGPE